jgi:uncharacterized protein YbjT (DUF2867 family)
MSRNLIVLAGATGDLGGRIARALRADGQTVRALVRSGAKPEAIAALTGLGVEVRTVDMNNHDDLVAACTGATCVVSALSGLEPVIIGTQTQLLEAAVAAGVPRFIPSDYSIDWTRLPDGSNRNLDLRRRFAQRLDAAPIRATSVFNGAFADMLTGQMPLLLYPLHRVLFWGNPDQAMDFTTKDDTAAYTATVAADPDAPRKLIIAGDQASPRRLAEIATSVLGEPFKPFRAGGLGVLKGMIAVGKRVAPGGDSIYPAWQGMQYLHNMLSGDAESRALDNDRYGHRDWTGVGAVIARRQAAPH